MTERADILRLQQEVKPRVPAKTLVGSMLIGIAFWAAFIYVADCFWKELSR